MIKKTHRHLLICIWFFPVVILALSCQRPTEPSPQQVELTAVDVRSTEVWLKLSFSGSGGGEFAIKRDDIVAIDGKLQGGDTVVVDEGLAPAKRYRYVGYRKLGGKLTEASAPVEVTTMDTTSHNFSWEITELGDGAGSVLYDVAIVNDTMAYAVGEIYLKDSTGQLDPHAYNMVKWNGKKWEPMRIQFFTICGQRNRTPYPASAVFAFSETDVWIAMNGDQVVRWNGTTQTVATCLPISFSIYKLWGENPNSVYAVGSGGNILHYDGNGWQKLESGTTLSINDIWGARDDRTGNLEVLCVASDQFVDRGRRIVSLDGSTALSLADSGLSWALNTIWFTPGRMYIIGGDGLYISRTPGPIWERDASMPPYYKTSVRGNALNDLVVVGAFGLVLHYNGATWQNYQDVTFLPSGAFGRVAIRGDIVIAVGGLDNKAVASIGRRR